MEAREQGIRLRAKAKSGARNEIAARVELLGAQALNDVELIQSVLGGGVDAAGLLAEHGGLKGLVTSESAPLPLRLAVELGRRALKAQEERPQLRTPSAIHAYLAPSLGALRNEVFHVLCFNTRNVLLRNVRVAEGSTSACVVDPRDVFAAAVATRASGIVLAHNHPSGNPDPSGQDLSLTAQLIEAGRTLGIRVMDHIIVGDDRYYSLLERGDMASLG